MIELEDYCQDLYGERANIHGKTKQETLDQINSIIENSYNHDNDNYNNDFTLAELHCSLKSFSNSKACGLDFIPYKLIKIICKDHYLSTIVLSIINNIYNLSIYPDQLHISKLYLLKKKPVVNTFDKLRGINITNNLKNIINKMRFNRTKHNYYNNINENHGAYTPKIGCELMLYAMHTIIYNTEFKNGKIYIFISDLSKAFDRCNRDIIVSNMPKININGKNLRLLINELNNGKVQIIFNKKHSHRIIINDGLPQGHNEAGPIFNIYIDEPLDKMLNTINLICYNHNVSISFLLRR